MQQIFVHHFVHADPHPGNLFIRPLPLPGEAPFAPGDPVPAAGRGRRVLSRSSSSTSAWWRRVPERLRAALREYLIGLGTRDAARVVHSYVAAGVLLPGADLRRLEEMHARALRPLLGSAHRATCATWRSPRRAACFLREYRDLLYEAPFQVQVELLFVGRAVGLLSGLSTQLDPAFDPWAETLPFAEQLAAEESARAAGARWRASCACRAAPCSACRAGSSALLTRAEQGGLGSCRRRRRPTHGEPVERLDRGVRRLTWTVAAAALLLAGALLRAAAPANWLGLALMALAAVVFLAGLVIGR